MRKVPGITALLLISTAGLCSQAQAGTETPAVFVTWEHRHVSFNYFGITTLYACDSLESQVRRILLYLGARGDVTVSARACSNGWDRPSPSAWVEADFYVPVQANDTSAPSGVTAQWTKLDLSPRSPAFMGDGDCELMQGLKTLVTQNFDVTHLHYETSCFPHELTQDGFSVTGQALKVAAPSRF